MGQEAPRPPAGPQDPPGVRRGVSQRHPHPLPVPSPPCMQPLPVPDLPGAEQDLSPSPASASEALGPETRVWRGLRPRAGPGWLPGGALSEMQQGRAGREGVPEPVGRADRGTEDPHLLPVIPSLNPPFGLCALGALPENSLIFPMFQREGSR